MVNKRIEEHASRKGLRVDCNLKHQFNVDTNCDIFEYLLTKSFVNKRSVGGRTRRWLWRVGLGLRHIGFVDMMLGIWFVDMVLGIC